MKQIDPNKKRSNYYNNIKKNSKIHRLEKIQSIIFDAIFCVKSNIDEIPNLQETVRQIKKYIDKRNDLK